MWSWLSVALSSFISISADESNNPRQAALFKTMSLLMLVVLLWSDGGAAPGHCWMDYVGPSGFRRGR